MALIINGEHVSDQTLHRELLRLSSGLEMDAPEAGAIDPAQLRAAALHNVIDRTLFLQSARTARIHVTAKEVEAELGRRWGVQRSSTCDPASMDSLRDDLLVERVQVELTRHVPRPGRLEVEQYYRANLHLYHRPEAVDAAHILCGCSSSDEEQLAWKKLEQASLDLQRGVPFAKVANTYSDCKGVGGSVGWVARGTMVPAFEDVIFALAPNQFSPVFRTIFGFHIATVKGRRREAVEPLEKVKLGIARGLQNQARTAALQQILLRLRHESSIHYEETSSHG